jgi:hypothetical protein
MIIMAENSLAKELSGNRHDDKKVKIMMKNLDKKFTLKKKKS